MYASLTRLAGVQLRVPLAISVMRLGLTPSCPATSCLVRPDLSIAHASASGSWLSGIPSGLRSAMPANLALTAAKYKHECVLDVNCAVRLNHGGDMTRWAREVLLNHAKISAMSQPLHGKLLEDARKRAKLSIREAARRSGISGNWWSAVVSGSQNGVPANGSPETVAAMARAVGVTPDQLETQGNNEDAARALRRAELEGPPTAYRPPVPRRPFPGDGGMPETEQFFRDEILPYENQYDRMVIEAALQLVDGEGRLLPWPERWQYVRVVLSLRRERQGRDAGLIPLARGSELVPN
jgi:transcriptional regulator with XRE-family HTH domain